MRMIDKDHLIEEIRCSPIGQMLIRKYNLDGMIEKFPEVDAEPVKHGKWKKRRGVINCSICKSSSWSMSFEDLVTSFNYCPNCGAKMDGDKYETD